MKKFAHEKSKRRDIVRERGSDRIWASIRKDDEYIPGTTKVEFIFSNRPDHYENLGFRADTSHPKMGSNPASKSSSSASPEKFLISPNSASANPASDSKRITSKNEFSKRSAGEGPKNRSLKKAHWDYLNTISTNITSKEANHSADPK